jgi:vacuolar-type H+-ATPase subunit I/STV1
MSVYPPLHGPGSGSMVIHTSGFLGLIAMTIAQVLGFGRLVGSWERVVSVSQMVPWLQTAIIVLGIALFRFKVRAPGQAWGFARPLDG